MKRLTIEYILYIYQHFILNQKSGDIYKKMVKPFMILLEYIYDLYIWILSIILYLPFLIISITIGKKLKIGKIKLMRSFINYTKNNNYKIN